MGVLDARATREDEKTGDGGQATDRGHGEYPRAIDMPPGAGRAGPDRTDGAIIAGARRTVQCQRCVSRTACFCPEVSGPLRRWASTIQPRIAASHYRDDAVAERHDLGGREPGRCRPDRAAVCALAFPSALSVQQARFLRPLPPPLQSLHSRQTIAVDPCPRIWIRNGAGLPRVADAEASRSSAPVPSPLTLKAR